jgi:hypothetical protein
MLGYLDLFPYLGKTVLSMVEDPVPGLHYVRVLGFVSLLGKDSLKYGGGPGAWVTLG